MQTDLIQSTDTLPARRGLLCSSSVDILAEQPNLLLCSPSGRQRRTVMSQGNSMVHALEMTAEAAAIAVKDDVRRGLNPFDRGPVEPWTGKKKTP